MAEEGGHYCVFRGRSVSKIFEEEDGSGKQCSNTVVCRTAPAAHGQSKYNLFFAHK